MPLKNKTKQNKLKISFKKHSLSHPLVMAYERSEYAWDNFSQFIYQFWPKTKTLIRKLERILIKLYRQNGSSLFNQTSLNIYDIYKIYIITAVWMHHLDANKMTWEEARWQLHKNVASNIV